MIPFQKIFTILIRTFSRPMLAYVKRKQQEKKLMMFSGLFIGLGRRTLAIELWMNHRVLKTAPRRSHTDFKQEFLLQKGVQSFYEVLFYVIVLGLPFYELYKSSLAAHKKQTDLQKRISTLENKVNQVAHRANAVIVLAKEQAKQNISNRKAERKDMLSKERDRRQLEQKMNKLTETTPHVADQEKTQKVEEILENALEVMADEFEDSLDELQFSSFSQDLDAGMAEGDVSSTDMQDSSDTDVESLDAKVQTTTTDLLEDTEVMNFEPEPILDIEPVIDIDIDVNETSVDTSQ